MHHYDKISNLFAINYQEGITSLDTASVEGKSASQPIVEAVRQVLSGIDDPHLSRDLITAGEVDEVNVDGDVAKIRIVLGYPAASWIGVLESLIRDQVVGIDGIRAVEVVVETKIVGHEVQKGVSPITGIRNMIAVASGKGGVGKSTVAVNLALALAAEGSRVGILDADIYGPSQPRMLGITGQPKSPDGKSLEPMTSYRLQAMSIGFLVDEDTPMIWRGPMVTQALEQLLNDTRWDDLDYLVIDLPPGTGDTQLTLAQKVPVSGALIVTTPQDIALLDARKAINMFEKVEIPILGVVENMSTHICSQCGHEEHIFGERGGERMAASYGTEMSELKLSVVGTSSGPVISKGENVPSSPETSGAVGTDGQRTGVVRTVTTVGVGAEGEMSKNCVAGQAITGIYGTLTLSKDGSYSYIADQAEADGLGDGEQAEDVFYYECNKSVSFVGSIPLDIRIRADVDGGQPTVVNDPDGLIADNYRLIARSVAGGLAGRKRDYTDVFPSIVIQNS